MTIHSAELSNNNKVLNQLPQSIKIILSTVFVILFVIFFIGIAYLAATKWVSLGMDEANRTIGSVSNSNPEYFNSYLADKEVYSLFTEYRKKIAKYPNNQNSNNADCDIFDELLNKVKEDIDKHQRELREKRK